MTEDKKDKRKEKIQKILKHAAPLIIGASSILPWSPVCSGSVKMSKDKNNIEIPAAKPASHNNDTPKLALADKNSLNAYTQSIGQVSIDTETGDLKAPSTVATGNGYYGQHQLGNSQKNDFCVKKYIAFALIYGSPEFKKSLCDNLLRGSQTTKDKLIDTFAKSLDKYDEQNKPEQAYLSTNPSYKKLSTLMNVAPAAFTKAHKNFTAEAKRLQSQFIYEVYLQQMPTGLKGIIAKNPQIKFESIRPAVMASVIAIAVKQGNGSRFKTAMERATIAAYQLQAKKSWEADTSQNKPEKEPLAIACRTGDLNKENIAVIGNAIRIYDTENSGLKSKDIIAPAKYQVMIVRGQKPKNVTGNRDVMTFNVKKDIAEISEIVNNEKWLESYCGSFKAVYKKAAPQIDKLPTIDTYYEMSIIFNNPGLYKIAEDSHKQNNSTVAFSSVLTNKILRDKHQNA